MNYKTGEFAKTAGVSERTIRYYDKIGLLKPAKVKENGYRLYSEQDLLKLQKILFLKQLGFSIEEIFPIVSKQENLLDSFHTQSDLLQSKISYLTNLRDAVNKVCFQLEKGDMNWNSVMELVHLSNSESEITEHYKNAHDLSIRISLHDQYSINPIHWFDWIMQQINFRGVNRLLEIGCGDGSLWKGKDLSFLRNREVFLTDKSAGMVSAVREQLGNDFNCLQAECESIPFKDGYFDTVIANHVLFYLTDLDKGLSEIKRVLTQNGTLYCSAYGKEHMKEITEVCKEFDDRIVLSKTDLHGRFGLENGGEKLGKYFSCIELKRYEDYLVVDQAEPIMDYILSCHGNQLEYLLPKMEDFKKFILDKLEKGPIRITKDAGLFICTHKGGFQ